MNETRTCRYSDLQVALHWIIAFLVIVQAFVTNGATGRMAEAMEDGLAMSLASRFGADLHVAFGVTVFLLALVRVGVRLHRGAPPHPDDDPVATQLAAHLIHVLLYAVILLIVGVHVVGALYRLFVVRTDVLVRMIQP